MGVCCCVLCTDSPEVTDLRDKIRQECQAYTDVRRLVRYSWQNVERGASLGEERLRELCGRLPGGHQEREERVFSHGCQNSTEHICTVCGNSWGGW